MIIRLMMACMLLAGAGAAHAAIPAGERQALLDLYASTNGTGWTNRTGWDGGAAGTECGWYGILCSVGNGNVIRIELNSNHLTGTLAPLDGLTALQVFRVQDNQITGAIPSLAGNTALQFFNANNNLLSGTLPSLTGLAALSELRVGGNSLSGSIPSLAGLTALTVVDVDANDLTGAIPSLAGLTSLRQFDAFNNALDGSIPSLAGLTALQTFRVQGNALTGSIPALAGLTALKTFYAINNNLTGSIPSLAGLAELTDFRVSGNALDGSIPALTGLAKLFQFDVSSNNLTGAIPSLTGLGELQVFYAYNNALTGSIPSLTGLGKLRFFWVHGNQLTGQLPSLAGLSELTSFYAYNNGLSGGIPPLAGLVKLDDFRLGGNALSGAIPSLAGLSALSVIDVSANGLTGTIPSLTGLSELRVFYAYDNALSGSIPTLTGLGALEFFYVHNNQLSGELPSLAGLGLLQQFYAFNNRLTGSIPPLTGLGELRYFRVAGNALTGAFPALPSPSKIVAGGSPLCPNDLDHTDDAGWNTASGITPWWRGCVGFVGLPPLPPPPDNAGLAGSAVGTADGLVAVAAPQATADGAESGTVLVYTGAAVFGRASGTSETRFSGKALADVNLASLQLPFPINGDKFGQGGVAVSVDGNVIVVGAPGTGGNTGSVAIFEKPAGGWLGTIVAKSENVLVPEGAVPGDEFGGSVAITNAGTIIAGAPGTMVDGVAGAGRVFVIRKGPTTFVVSQSLDPIVQQVDARFGSAVSGEGSELAAGAPGQDVGGQANQGRVDLFREAGGVYSPLNAVVDASGSSGDAFGTAVQVTDGMLLVGAPGSDLPNAVDAGNAVVYDQADTGEMAEVANLQQAEPQAGAAMGTSLSMSGDTAIVGAPLSNLNGNLDQGVVEVFVVPPEGVFFAIPEPEGTLFDPDGEAGDTYGSAVSLSGNLAAIGAPLSTVVQLRPDSSGSGGGRKAVSQPAAVAQGQVVAYTDSLLSRDGFESPRGGIGQCVSPSLSIPDNQLGGVDHQFTIAATGKVRDLDVSVNITHTRVSDLRLSLTHVNSGKTVPLYFPTLTCPTDDLEVDFDDQALGGFARNQCSAIAPGVSGRLLPDDWLTIVQGVTRAGPWRLNVADVAAGETGVLKSWCLNAR